MANPQPEIIYPGYAFGTRRDPEASKTRGRSRSSLQELALKLYNVYQNLQSASYRIGYLEAQLGKCKSAWDEFEHLQSKVQRVDELDKETQRLKLLVSDLRTRADQVVNLEAENERIKSQLHFWEEKEGKDNWCEQVVDEIVGTKQARVRSAETQIKADDYCELIRKSLKR